MHRLWPCALSVKPRLVFKHWGLTSFEISGPPADRSHPVDSSQGWTAATSAWYCSRELSSPPPGRRGDWIQITYQRNSPAQRTPPTFCSLTLERGTSSSESLSWGWGSFSISHRGNASSFSASFFLYWSGTSWGCNRIQNWEDVYYVMTGSSVWAHSLSKSVLGWVSFQSDWNSSVWCWLAICKSIKSAMKDQLAIQKAYAGTRNNSLVPDNLVEHVSCLVQAVFTDIYISLFHAFGSPSAVSS